MFRVHSYVKLAGCLLLIAIAIIFASLNGKGKVFASPVQVVLPQQEAKSAPSSSPNNVPELIIESGPKGTVQNDSHLFVSLGGSGLEVCGLKPDLKYPVLQRMSFDGSNQLTLLERCNNSFTLITADATDVYLRDGDNKIKRISINGGALEELASNAPRAVAADETHIYWARHAPSNENFIWRVPKAGGAEQLIATVPNIETNYFIRDMTLDDSHLYWVVGKIGNKVLEQPAIGAVKRMPKDGGAIEELANSDDGIELPYSLTLDESHVYWSESPARVRRVSQSGGQVLTYSEPQGTYSADSLVVNESHIYWTESNGAWAGRIRRAPITGDEAPEDIAIGLQAPRGLFIKENYLYWAQSGGLYRLAFGAEAVAVDFSIDSIEMVQVVQTVANDVPLVTGKPTLVRVYGRTDTVTGQIPKVSLSGFRNGEALLNSPLSPIDPSIHLPASNSNKGRTDLDWSFNFWLPPSWTAGQVELSANINHDQAINELNLDNNLVSLTRTFHEKKPLCIEMLPVRVEPQTASVNDDGFNSIVNWIRTAYPVKSVLIEEGNEIHETFGGAYEIGGDSDDGTKLLARIGWYRLWHSHSQAQTCGGFAHFFGMVGTSEDRQAGGLGYRLATPTYSAWGVMATHGGNDTVAQNAPWYAPHGGSTLAHEIGHNKSRKHIACGDPKVTDPNYPHPPCNIGSSLPGGAFGFHSSAEVLIQSAEAGDLMSYAISTGKPRWPSDYTYKAIYDRIPDDNLRGQERSADPPFSGEAVLVLTGFYTPTEQSAAFDLVYQVEPGLIAADKLSDLAASIVSGPDAELTLRLIGENESVLEELQFDVRESHGPPGSESEMESFILTLPYHEEAQALVLLQGETELSNRPVSPSAPQVTVLEPNGGESYVDNMTINWSASDADGDQLLFTVQYSPDQGQTWKTVSSAQISTSIQLDNIDFMPGADESGLIRVIANDGINSTSDTSDQPFSVRGHPPRASISKPEHESVVGLGNQLLLDGHGMDAEDGQLTAEALTWYVDDNMVGTGEQVIVSELALGVHTVRLEAMDSDNLQDSEEVTIYVQEQACRDNDNRLDLVFVIDNSTAMTADAEAVCTAIPDMVTRLGELGITTRLSVYDITGTAPTRVRSTCADATIQNLDSNTAVDHPSDWAAAIESVSSVFAWEEGYSRLIVPVSSQAPADGDPTEDPGEDRDALEQAIRTAVSNAVTVMPLFIPSGASPSEANLLLASDIATATGGEVMLWSDTELDMAGTLQATQGQVGCPADVERIVPTIITDPTDEVAFRGRNLWPGTQVFINDQAALDVSTSSNGALLTFSLPPSAQQDGDVEVRIERAGAGESTIVGNITVDITEDSYTIFLPLIQE